MLRRRSAHIDDQALRNACGSDRCLRPSERLQKLFCCLRDAFVPRMTHAEVEGEGVDHASRASTAGSQLQVSSSIRPRRSGLRRPRTAPARASSSAPPRSRGMRRAVSRASCNARVRFPPIAARSARREGRGRCGPCGPAIAAGLSPGPKGPLPCGAGADVAAGRHAALWRSAASPIRRAPWSCS